MGIIKNLRKDPFRLCFPVALGFAIYGCSLWIAFAFFNYGAYPGQSHSRLFVGGFLYLSILGFLMTAIPRFTRTAHVSPIELYLLVLVVFVLICTVIFNDPSMFWGSIFLGWILFFKFAVPRFLKRSQNPPNTFLFVGLGVTFGLIGSFFEMLFYSKLFSNSLVLKIGNACFFDAMVLALIIGIGGRLIPGILGFQEIVTIEKNISKAPKPFLKKVPKSLLLLAFLFISSIFFEVFGFIYFGNFIRASVVLYVALVFWQIQKRPSKWNPHGFFIIVACWLIVSASWLLVFANEQQIAWKHLGYIGGYSLLTLLVASRVVLAHGTSGLDMERRHFPFTIIGFLLVAAAITRASANFIPSAYTDHLGYAAACFLGGALVWGFVFLSKTVKGVL